MRSGKPGGFGSEAKAMEGSIEGSIEGSMEDEIGSETKTSERAAPTLTLERVVAQLAQNSDVDSRQRRALPTLARSPSAIVRSRAIRVFMCGMYAAGLTVLLYKLKLGEVVTTIPTIGFNAETVSITFAVDIRQACSRYVARVRVIGIANGCYL